MDKSLIKELTKKLSELDDSEETKRKALILRKHIINDENARSQIERLENGVFSDVFSGADEKLGERLFRLIATEFEIKSTKDIMDLRMMIINYLKANRLHRIDTDDLKMQSMFAAVIQRFTNNYSKLGSDLAINRQQRLVRKIETIDESGSITQMFSSIQQYEQDNPAEVEEWRIENAKAKSKPKTNRKQTKKR